MDAKVDLHTIQANQIQIYDIWPYYFFADLGIPLFTQLWMFEALVLTLTSHTFDHF